MKAGVVGATGVVGKTLIKLLEKDKRIKEIIPFSGGRSEKYLDFRKKKIEVRKIKDIPEMDFVFFCVEADIAENIFPIFHKKSKLIIDNSSAFRLRKGIPLIVPEVNPEDISRHKGLIANPNCSTIQLVIPLKALEKFKPHYIFVATYQSVSGAGKDGIEALKRERNGRKYKNSPFDTRIHDNLIPKIGEIKQGHSKEEWKMILETRKILKKKFQVYPTCVRVPVENCHSQSVFIKFKENVKENTILKAFENFPSIKIQKNIITPLQVKGKDEVYISRIRVYERTKTLSFFSVFDNLRKGAATNAYQIGKIIWEGN